MFPTQRTHVSVIIPCFNAGTYVVDAIQSILTQSHQDFEILVIDDGSDDHTKLTLERVQQLDSRIRIFFRQHQGLVPTLNFGLGIASYDLIARLDADDISYPKRLERQVDFFRANPRFVLAGCNYDFVNAEGNSLRITRKLNISKPPAFDPSVDENIPHQGVMFYREPVLEEGGYRNLVPAEDLDLWLRLSERHSLGFLDDVLIGVRILGSGISSLNSAHQQLMWMYVKDCARQRRTVGTELLFDEWKLQNRLRIKKKLGAMNASAFIRNVGVHLAMKNYLRASMMLLKALRANPAVVLKKASSYSFNLMKNEQAGD